MSFAKYFLPTNETEIVGIYYINLDIATERRSNMENYFGQDAIRIPAISAQEVQNTSYLCVSPITKQKYIQCDCGFYPSNTQKKFAEIACIFSHLDAIRRAFLDGCDFAFIMEDDIDLTILQHLIDKKNIQNGFFYSLMLQDIDNGTTDIYQYYTNNVAQLQKNAITNDGKLWTNWNAQNWGTCIYGITRRGMQKIIDQYYLPTTLETIGGVDLTRFSMDLSQFVADILVYTGGVYEEPIKTKTLKYPILCDVAKDSFIHPEHISKYHIHAHNCVYLNRDSLIQMLEKQCPELFLH